MTPREPDRFEKKETNAQQRVEYILARIERNGDMPVIDELIAAAEERGRRRGVEDLQTMLQNAAPHIIGAGHFRLWNCKCGYCAPLQAAIAPRDSGKEG